MTTVEATYQAWQDALVVRSATETAYASSTFAGKEATRNVYQAACQVEGRAFAAWSRAKLAAHEAASHVDSAA